MYEVAKHAGVGQATLYRHFPDRSSLAATLARELLDAMEAELAEQRDAPDAFERTLRVLVGAMVRSHGLIDVVREGSGAASEQQLRERLVALLGGPLHDAQTAGLVRADVVVDDLFLFMLMVEGILHEFPEPADRAAATDRALGLVFRGLVVPGVS